MTSPMLAVEVYLDFSELLFIGVPFAIVVGGLSGRILGVRRGWWRALTAGLFGWLFGVVVAAVIQDTDDLGETWVLTFGFGLLGAMVVSIVLDVLVRPRERRHRRRARWLLHPVRAVKRRLAPIGRFREIVHHARRRGLTGLRFASPSAMATPEFARRLRLVLEDCGGMFVKFGQIASTRTDLLPEAVTSELANLQASVRPVPPEDIRSVIESELGATVEEEFATFDWEPLAAASIGQTHRATLKDGSRVVVKVQRPGIEDTVSRDAAVLRMTAGMLERRVEAARQVGVRGLAEELIGSLQRELSYTAEAANAEAFRARLDGKGISAPAVYQALSTRRVLVMQEIDGTTVADHAAVLASGVPPLALSQRLLVAFLDQVLRDGIYHADPHPGNVFIDRHGVLWLLDFGAVGHLDPLMLEALQQMAIGLELNDPVVLARAARQAAGAEEGSTDSRALEADIGVLLSEGVTSGSFDPTTMTKLLEVMQRHGLHPPRALTVLSRALLTLEGTLRTIDPDFVLGREARALLPQLAEHQDGAVQEQLQKELVRALPSLRTLPGHAEAIASQLRSGRLSVRVDRFAGSDRAVVDMWVDRVLFAGLGAIGLLSSSVLLLAANAADLEGVQDTLLAVGFFGLVISSVMQMRAIAQVLRRASDAGVDDLARSRRV